MHSLRSHCIAARPAWPSISFVRCPGALRSAAMYAQHFAVQNAIQSFCCLLLARPGDLTGRLRPLCISRARALRDLRHMARYGASLRPWNNRTDRQRVRFRRRLRTRTSRSVMTCCRLAGLRTSQARRPCTMPASTA